MLFEKTFVINLSRRADRLEAFFARLPADWPFQRPEVFEAVDGGLTPPPTWWDGGAGGWGCWRSQVRIIEDCLNRGIESVLIFEDDAAPVNGLASKVRQFVEHLPDGWEMLYLGGQHTQEEEGLPRKVNDWVYRPYNINRCHAWGLRGRPMLEKVYTFLHEFFQWTEPHHIDHRLGTFHKTAETIYVPREWLFAQAAGQSDICGQELELRLFPSAVETLAPPITRSFCGILGTYFGGVNLLAGAMCEAGLFLGTSLAHTPGEVRFYEDHYLGEICRRSYREPWLEELRPEPERIAHLRRWAGVQCRDAAPEVRTICGKHPILSLLGKELVTAWNGPKLIRVERDTADCLAAMQLMDWRWHPRAAAMSFELLRQSRQEFFEQYTGPVLTLTYNQMQDQPRVTILKVCEFLEHQPTERQLQNAVDLMTRTENDLVEQCPLSTNS